MFTCFDRSVRQRRERPDQKTILRVGFAGSLWDAVNGKCSSTKYSDQATCVVRIAKVWTPHTAHSTWNGCVTDRDQNFDTTNAAPVAGGTLYPAEQYASCPAASVTGLSNDWTALGTKIGAMTANGNTPARRLWIADSAGKP